MLTIVIGIIISLIMLVLSHYCRNVLRFFLGIASVAVVGLAIFTGLCVPLSEYNEWQLQNETKLVPISNLGEEIVYAYISAADVYVYKFQLGSSTTLFPKYTTSTVSRNVEEKISSNEEEAFLREYLRTPKSSIWTFALCPSETKYVFYVPEGTIVKSN